MITQLKNARVGDCITFDIGTRNESSGMIETIKQHTIITNHFVFTLVRGTGKGCRDFDFGANFSRTGNDKIVVSNRDAAPFTKSVLLKILGGKDGICNLHS